MANNINGEIEVNFLQGKMNKDYDERVLPPGQYIDALNIRIGSTELDSVGAIENSKGNTQITDIRYEGNVLTNSKCIGVFEDGVNETIYWFISSHDVDMVVSYDSNNSVVKYHVISTSVLNFDQNYLITGINKVDDLLFWTDNLNPPRKININRNYPNPIMGVDSIKEEDISVIVAPPINSPGIALLNQSGEENYMIERFISFAYRYKYKDNEYSALSQFSEISFEPGSFQLDYSTYTNKSMQNVFNSVNVTFDTGDYNVIGVDLCFKLSDSNIINVIERYNKEEQGWSDNIPKSVLFNNRKIYTVLTESELLRLYDNVPRTAKSQTVMGNRLIYGNYVDGYDIDTTLDYNVDVINENINFVRLPYTLIDGGNYTIDPDNTITAANSTVTIDLTGVDLSEGSAFSMNFSLLHESFSGYATYDDPPTSPAPLNEFVNSYVFTLRRDYTSVYDLATSTEFVDSIYTHNAYASCGLGTSVTDIFNCSMIAKGVYAPFTEAWEDVNSGITGVDGGFTITTSPGSDIIQIQVPAVQFKIEDPDNLGTYFYAYEYFTNNSFLATFYKIGARQSLHSNRGYEVGVVYMDDNLRSSTALVNKTNTVFIPASASITKNHIVATVNNDAPSWATRYKFVVKPSKSNYQVIYSNQFFVEDTGLTWFKLDGDNRSKVQENSTIIVKTDTNGALNTLVKTKVLELKAQPIDFITGNTNTSGGLIQEPAGMYMALKVSNFTAEYKPNSFIAPGAKETGITTLYPCYIDNPEYVSAILTPTETPYIPYDIPAGSSIHFNIVLKRDGADSSCGSSEYTFNKTFVASQDYDNIYRFVEGDNINFGSGSYYGGETPNTNIQTHTLEPFVDCGGRPNKYVSPAILSTQTTAVTNAATLNQYKVSFYGTGTITFSGAHTGSLVGISNLVKVTTTFYATTTSLVSTVAGSVLNATLENISLPIPPATTCHLPFIMNVNQYEFQENTDTGELWLVVTSGTPSCDGYFGNTKYSRTNITIEVQRATSLMVFETEADDSDGEIYYESSDSFPIVDRYHMSGTELTDQSQTSSLPAIVNLNFFNCYTFGNGVESYKINDSLVGAPFYLGSRVTAVSQEEFKEANRYAGLTYSGVYNAETNINKLNEFNLALSNWKDCEKSFGPINKLYARKTDVLVLQEDKISYVLAGKNLLSDAAAGGAITSIPEVLGTQIARIEDYGISNNPESFAVRGSEIFFTDVKRTAVLNLKGGSASGEQLDVSSNYGLKNWFRKEFKDTLGYQKLGGFDPYMNEYVLALNDNHLPYSQDIYSCGTTISQQLFIGTYTFTLELLPTVGEVSFDFSFTEGEATIIVVYNSSEVIYTLIGESGTISFMKETVFPTTATVTITCETESSYILTPNCPISQEITVVRVVANSAGNVDQTIHNNYNWSLGSFNSVYNSDYIILEADGISLFDADTAMNSVGVIPAIGSTIHINSTKLTGDTFVFEDNSFKYLISNTLYTELDIAALLFDSTTATPTLNPSTGKYESSFLYDNPDSKQYLYMIWDYTQSHPLYLHYDAYTASNACCNDTGNIYYLDATLFTDTLSVYTDSLLTTKAADGYYQVSGHYRRQVDGILGAYTICPECPPPPAYYEVSLSNSTPAIACGSPSIPTTYPLHVFVISLPMHIGDIVYNDSSLTTVFEGDGTYYWASLAFAYQINSSGEITNIIDCS